MPQDPHTASQGRNLALRVIAMPRDTNHYGTIFGGVILSYIDQAGFVEARRHGDFDWVTASIQRVDFKAPVLIGDIVTLYTVTERIGRTSVTIKVQVEAMRDNLDQPIAVTDATMTMVAVDANRMPVAFTPK